MVNASGNRSEGMDLFEVASALWQRRWVIALSTLGFGLAGVAYALLATEWYESKVVMVQTESRDLPSGLAQFGGLASLAGIDLGAGGESHAPIAVLKSRDLVAQFIEAQGLLPVVLSDRWDSARNAWKESDPRRQPDIRDAVDYFVGKVRRVSVDEDGLVTLSVMWKNPEESARWAELLVAGANERMRKQAVDEAERNVKYLTDAMASTSVAPLQQSISRVLEGELQKLLLARGREEFAFKILDKPVPPKRRAKPKRALVSILGAMFGGTISVLFVMIGHLHRRRVESLGVGELGR